LAALGNILSSDRRRDPFGDHGGPFDLAARLFDRPAVLGLPDAIGAGARHAGREQGSGAALDASENLLAGLLRPLVGGAAASMSRILLDEFMTLPDVLAATPARLRAVTKSEPVARFIVLVRDTMLYSLRVRIGSRPILSTDERLIDYLRATMAHEVAEQFRVLFLNARNMLIRDEVVGLGSIREAPVFPREVMRRALELGATAIVLVHNHPSGNHEPSEADRSITQSIVSCGETLDIMVQDHIIITKAGFSSFRSRGFV
jgi:DNA repair protein RadC